jgi:hypothetical protein
MYKARLQALVRAVFKELRNVLVLGASIKKYCRRVVYK